MAKPARTASTENTSCVATTELPLCHRIGTTDTPPRLPDRISVSETHHADVAASSRAGPGPGSARNGEPDAERSECLGDDVGRRVRRATRHPGIEDQRRAHLAQDVLGPERELDTRGTGPEIAGLLIASVDGRGRVGELVDDD